MPPTVDALLCDAILPDWPAPPGVRAFVSTRAMGDMKSNEARARLQPLWAGGAGAAGPAWLRQVHGTRVLDAAQAAGRDPQEADASVSRESGAVCVVMAADCMPVLLASRDGSVVGAAHAGWRGLCAGVIERTLEHMAVPGAQVQAFLGPAIGPQAYEVGEEVRAAFLAADPAAEPAFRGSRPGHWMLDLYAVARQRLAACGVSAVHGGTHCTLTEADRFWSHRRDAAPQRMAGFIWREA